MFTRLIKLKMNLYVVFLIGTWMKQEMNLLYVSSAGSSPCEHKIKHKHF